MKKKISSYWIRSGFYTFMQRFSIIIFGFANFYFLARSLSKPQMGIWALFLAITGVFEAAKTNLLKNAHIKYVSGSNDTGEKTIIASSSFLINALINIFFILLIIFFADWLSSWFNTGSELGTMLKWFIPGLVFLIFFAHLEAIQQSFLDFKGGFAGYFIRQLVFFIAIITYRILHIPLSLTNLVMYQSLSIALGTITIFLFTRKYLEYKFKATKLWIKKIMGYGGYIFGSGMVANVYSNLDQIMIARFMKSPAFVSYYSIAARISALIDIPSYAAADIIFPKASKAHVEEGREKVTYLFERMVAILLAFTVPTTFFIILFSKLVILIIAGSGYEAAAPILQLYMVASIFRPVQNQAANLLNSIGKAKLVFIVNTVTLITLLAINYFCLLHFEFYGAAIGALITAMTGFIIWYFLMRKQVDLNMKRVFNHTIDTYKLIYHQVMSMLGKNKKQAAE